ncbi:MAG: hypothetical protein ABWY11_03215, partial [Umezawaea sp.]
PTVGSSAQNTGSPNAQLFEHDVTFEIKIETVTRNRAWVKRVTPGSPFLQVPEARTVVDTAAPATATSLPPITGKVNLWVSDSSAMTADPSTFLPGAPVRADLAAPPNIQTLLTTPKPAVEPWLHVEAVTGTEALRDAAIAALDDAARGDTSLGLAGTDSRNRIDRLFSPESIKATLPTLVGKGMTEGGMKYGRRVTDRTGALGMSVALNNPVLVSIADDTATENTSTGGFKAGDSVTGAQSVDLTAGLNTPMKPTDKDATGSGAIGATARWTPWSKSTTEGTEIGGSVDRTRSTPAGGRTVLVQYSADVTIVAESRSGNTLYKGTPVVAGKTVSLPGGVFVRVTEEVARSIGALPPLVDTHVTPDPGTMTPPSTLTRNDSGALGLGLVETVPDLSGLVPDLRADLGALGADLLPTSVLNDSMNNLQRITDLTSGASVKGLMDSALDGGVPLLVHDPGVFGKDTYQVTLKARIADAPVFTGVVNDGVDMSHSTTGTSKISRTEGGGTAWGLGLKVPGTGLPGSSNPNISGSAGAVASASVGQAESHSTTTSTTDQTGYARSGSGPAVKYRVPVVFELVVEKGDQVVGQAFSTPQTMDVRLLADNHKVAAAGAPVVPTAFAPAPAVENGATPASTIAWQQTGRVVLPPTASVENFRGAAQLRQAAVLALTTAGANQGITGKGTGSMNALQSGLSSESLQPNLPGMLDGALEVPGLHEASLLMGQHANVKVYAKLVRPELVGLSDGVNLENPKTTVTATSGESKHTESGDFSIGAASGGVSSKKPDVGFSTGGVELRHAGEDSDATSGGATNNKSNNLKPVGRSGLVAYDVEYRVVADLGGGRTSVVELVAPGSAQVRMPVDAAADAIGKALPATLDTAQTGVKDAAKAWRDAEVDADTTRHTTEVTLNRLAPEAARLNGVTAVRLGELAVATRAATAATNRVTTTTGLHGTAVDTARAARAEVRGLADVVEQRREAARLVGEDPTATDDERRAAADLLTDATTAHADAVTRSETAATAVETAAGNLETARRNAELLAEARNAAAERLEAAKRNHQVAKDGIAAAEADLEQARTAVDTSRRAWWDAKTAVDQEVAAFNATNPAPPAPTRPVPPVPLAAPTRPVPPVPPAAPPVPGTAVAPDVEQAPAVPRSAVPRGPSPERSFEFAPGSTTLTGQQSAEVDVLAADLVESAGKRADRGFLPPKVEVSGANAPAVKAALDAKLDGSVDVTIAEGGRPDGADVHVDWDLQRPEGFTPPEAPKSVKVTDTVITADGPQAPHPILSDESWRHSTAPTADWSRPSEPVSSRNIRAARAAAPVSTVRSEDGGVLTTSTVAPGSVDLKAWRGPIAYDKRTFDVDGVQVQDYTVKVHLDASGPDVDALKARTREGVQALFNQGHRLPSGDQLHVTVEFTDNPADAHGHIAVTESNGRANQLSWPVDTDSRRLAHEVGHFLGLQDEYVEPGLAKPVFQHQDGKGRVVADDGPMTAGIDAAALEIKPRNL